MPSPGFQVGAVRGHGVVFARGLEIDLANALAARLGIPRVVFYQEPQFGRLIAPGPKPWDIALAEVTITPERAAAVAFSIPYLAADQGVLLRLGLPATPPLDRPAGAPAPLLAERHDVRHAGRDAGEAGQAGQALRQHDPDCSMRSRPGRCDAVVYDAPILATLRAQVPRRYGPLAGVIKTQESYGVLLPTGSALVPIVNDALGAIIAQGTLTAISKRWMSADLTKLPVLR